MSNCCYLGLDVSNQFRQLDERWLIAYQLDAWIPVFAERKVSITLLGCIGFSMFRQAFKISGT